MPTATVTVTKRNDGSFNLDMSPPTLTVNKGSVDATLTFNLQQVNTSGWRFLTVESTDGSTDHFYGVTISNDTTGEFNNPQRVSDTQVQFIDNNDNTNSYTYTVGIENPGLNMTLGNDPTIDNRGR